MLNRLVLTALATALLTVPVHAQPGARDASFVEPGKGAGARNEGQEPIYATPSDLDVGETIIGVTKRVTLFLNNSTPKDATIAQMSISADGNVLAELIDNDCQSLGRIPPGERCTVGVQITPNSPGPWTAEMVVVHDGPGRISRAAVLGSTAGEVGNSGQQPGLSLLGSGDKQTIDFGQVEVAVGRAVRSVLLVNDSPNPLTVEAIELVSPDRGLNLVKEGCREGLEIPAGSSCPVTVKWEPLGRGDVSTDLIIRHTGPVGFAIIPVRGVVTGTSGMGGGGISGTTSSSSGSPEAAAASLPVAPVSAASLFAKAAGGADAKLTLRGVVGQRALLADATGNVVVATIGQVIVAEGVEHKLLAIHKDRVVITADGRKAELNLTIGVGSGSTGGGMNPAMAPPPRDLPKSGNSKAAPPITQLQPVPSAAFAPAAGAP